MCWCSHCQPTTSLQRRGRAGRGASLCKAPADSSVLVAARKSALRELTRAGCLNGGAFGPVVSSGTGHEKEQERGQSVRSADRLARCAAACPASTLPRGLAARSWREVLARGLGAGLTWAAPAQPREPKVCPTPVKSTV